MPPEEDSTGVGQPQPNIAKTEHSIKVHSERRTSLAPVHPGVILGVEGPKPSVPMCKVEGEVLRRVAVVHVVVLHSVQALAQLACPVQTHPNELLQARDERR